MKNHLLYLYSLVLLASILVPKLFADGKAEQTRIRCHSGWILNAESMLISENDAISIENVSKYEEMPEIAGSSGYAVLTFAPDTDRSLGLYDYSLRTGGKNYPCIAMRVENGPYDASNWEIRKTSPERRYSMLFKVPMSSIGNPSFTVIYELFDSPNKQFELSFRNVGEKGFTKPASIPDEGILGIDPEAEKAVAAVAEKADQDKAPAGAATEKEAPVAAKKDKPKDDGEPGKPAKPSDSELEEWNKFLSGD